MKPTQSKILSITLIFIVLIIMGCTNQQEQKTNQAIKIGVIAPFSGALADYGIALRNGINLARQESNNNQNNFEFIFEDSAYENQKVISAFRKLVDIDKIDIIINFGNPTSEALLPIAKRENIPLIAFSSQPLSDVNSTQAIRSWAPVSTFAKTIYDYTQEQGWNNVGIIKTENLFLQGIYDSLSKFSNQNNITLSLIDNYQFQDRDFSTSIQKIKNTQNLGAVGILLLPGQISKFYKQLKESGLEINTFGSDVFESQTEINDSQGTMDGSVYSYVSVSNNFEQKYL